MPLWYLSRVSQCFPHGSGKTPSSSSKQSHQMQPAHGLGQYTVGQIFSLAVLVLLREGGVTPALVVTRSHHAISPSLEI